MAIRMVISTHHGVVLDSVNDLELADLNKPLGRNDLLNDIKRAMMRQDAPPNATRDGDKFIQPEDRKPFRCRACGESFYPELKGVEVCGYCDGEVESA